MLPKAQRIRTADEFRATVRGGVRAGRRSVVVHAAPADLVSEAAVSPARAGFVVSKAVGNAVTRNRVKRRLRHLVGTHLDEAPKNTRWVVRALPEAASDPSLAGELAQAWASCERKLNR